MNLKISVTFLKTPGPVTQTFYSRMLAFDCLTVQDRAMSYVDHYVFFQGKIIILSPPCSGIGDSQIL